MNTPAGQPLVKVEDLSVQFVSAEATVRAVNGVSFTLERGEVLGILGESGSGKSVTLRALMRLLPPRKTRLGGRIERGSGTLGASAACRGEQQQRQECVLHGILP